jgi:hypothetical protein
LDRCQNEWLCSIADWRRKNDDRLGCNIYVDSATLVVVPTIDLIGEWRNKLSKVYKHINIDTVTTYESAYLPTDLLHCRERT